MKPRRFRSFAKINLGLEVVGRLPSGYHELKTIFASVSLHDVIEIAAAGWGIRVHCTHPGVPADETNLACRAAELVQQRAKRRAGLTITIDKRIPVGGGLGGGSSNAATVLRALDLMWNLGLGPEGLMEAAKSLGADVPYFLFGGPALGLDRGDDIRPLDLLLSQKVLLVPGPGGVSTAAVFKGFAAEGGRAGRSSRIDTYLRSSEGDPRGRRPRALGSLGNDLERAARAESPSLETLARRIHRIGRSTGAVHTSMSGSGSSFFLLFNDEAARRVGAQELRDAGISSRRCSFVSRRAYRSRFEIKDRRRSRSESA
jgi:4-diphosphocytidyl-2-C-methyl-D-erythritol kinase